MLTVLIAAVMLLIWNGSTFFSEIKIAGQQFSREIQIASTALTLNVALILFGWRRYVDLQHEAELRADGERRAAIMASTDASTGLNNRKGFADRGQELRERAALGGQHLVIISLQINRFKAINDRHGYEAGDELLKLVASAMQQAAGEGAIVARMSGDEFAVAMTFAEEDVTDAEWVADALLRAVTRPFTLGERMMQVGAFAGLASAEPSDAGIPDLLRRADIAMDRAKSGRVARPVWFDAGMERALLIQDEIEQGIRFGLDHGQFVPYFEPQVDLETGKLIGFEVLARWDHPLSGIVEPDRFIPVAEEIGLIDILSEQVIRQALAQSADWDPSIKISVNISPLQLADSWLAQRIVRMLTETGFPAERLVVEITESSLFADIDLARTIVTSLKNQGIRLALDDFGTGFSSLSHLRSLPFDLIKVDRAFVTNIQSNKESTAIVRAVTTLAGALSVPVLVEGIENEATHAVVLELGCQIGQGWYFGKPMPAERALQLVNQTQRERASAHQMSPRPSSRAASN
ncbi:bifunctional diguanylate cyclase/phosphodiesterase [Sphingomonas piscis]|uniref:Bifunctional diguanylate cyclase/phosphodiesterase n=1 Tax=Sphingomonas piscis TaxID=2714943 RepID=A0A6G7YN43_9SPHN|nr:bifunctional diguanylate cyclase/phosphodiesterase [Sphingomonas piscis]